MPRRTDLKRILVIGSGPIVIGQACEFDYSGTQAIKALRDEGLEVVLVNSNPATIMTDPELADRTYVEPLTVDVVERIIAREKPDAILPTVGGQTALNLAVALHEAGVLDKYGVKLIGAQIDAIHVAEDRQLFRDAMVEIGLDVPKSRVVKTMADALEAVETTGFPAIIRPSFTLGGVGGGIAYNIEEFREICGRGLELSPVHEVLIEESVIGWKEYELEVMRDVADNFVVICSIENIDPMGVHTGDSITVAPALTLTDKEYQKMRDAGRKIMRRVGVETGGSNVQFAFNPADGRMIIIEMNPRVSRSSALASKATGFPIAKIAAKLALGYHLDEIPNDITRLTPASFEPTIDYVVTKIPRWNFEKFPQADRTLTTQMKSVGEAMSIGRTFKESFLKGIRSLELGKEGRLFGAGQPAGAPTEHATPDEVDASLRRRLSIPTDRRMWAVFEALERGWSTDRVHELTKIDPWFLEQFRELVELRRTAALVGLRDMSSDLLRTLKRAGFGDAELAHILQVNESAVREKRLELGLTTAYKRIDTCAAEFESFTPYMYSSFERDCESAPTGAKKVVILGSGPNRIGQGVEFDYCCCHAVFGFRKDGLETIMINCNPETVSTDYDTADRLYFEPLTFEDVMAVLDREKQGNADVSVVVQFGGQTPLKLALPLQEAGVNIVGTSPDSIDLAEDRKRFSQLLWDLGIPQPASGTAVSRAEAREAAGKIGFPVVVRPSYVLGGRAMAIVYDMASLDRYMSTAVDVSNDRPILIDRFLEHAKELDVDCVADTTGAVVIGGIMEHIEEAGIHSGDSACSLPPHSLDAKTIEELERQTRELALGLDVVGLMNVQYAIKDGDIYVLEVNPRASRTVPFVAKVVGTPVAKIAARIMAGEKLADFKLKKKKLGHVGVKESVFPFARFPGVDTVLGPEMRSTGEVMGLDRSFEVAFAKSQLGGGTRVPRKGTVFVSVRGDDKMRIADAVRLLHALGFKVMATSGTQRYLSENGVPTEKVNKVLEGRPHIVDAITNGDVQLVFNTTEGPQALADSRSLRRAALLHKVPYYTTLSGAKAAAQGIRAYRDGDLEVRTLQSYFSES